jgi:hypothetical protein
MSKIVMFIERIGDELELSMKSEDAQGDTKQGLQLQRRNLPSKQGDQLPRNRGMKELKQHRMQHAHSEGGHEHLTGVHQTMILLDTTADIAGNPTPQQVMDTVVFQCEKEFVVDVEFDPSVRDLHEPEPRRSPFLWDYPQKSKLNAGTGFHEVTADFDNSFRKEGGVDIPKTAPTDYQFYKATVWSQGLKLDPDWFCDR